MILFVSKNLARDTPALPMKNWMGCTVMKKRSMSARLLALVLLVAMVLPMAPFSALAGEAVDQYGYLVINNDTKDRVVNFRPAPGSSNYVDRLDEGWVLQILGQTSYGGHLWYQAKNPANGETGYIRGDFMQLMTTEEQSAWLANPVQPYVPAGSSQPGEGEGGGAPDLGAGLGFVRLIDDLVNLRATPAGTVLTEKNADKLPQGLVLTYYSETKGYLGYDWVQVVYNGMAGYVRSDCYIKTDVYGQPLPEEGGSQQTTPPASSTVIGYVKLTLDKVAVRVSPGGTVINDNDRLPQGLVIGYTEDAGRIGNYRWVKVTYGSYVGYIRSDCFVECDELGNEVVAPGATAAPTPVPGVYIGYIRLIEDDVFLRQSPAGNVLNYYDKMPKGLVLGYTALDTNSKQYTWAKVSYHGMEGYVRSDCFVYCDELGNEVSAPASTPAPTPAPGSTAIPRPEGSVVYDDNTYGRTNTDRVFFRKDSSTEAGYWYILPYNWMVQVLRADWDETTNTLWYQVKGGTPANPNASHTGYIHGDYLNLVSGGNAGSTVPETDSNYAVIIINGINVRREPNGEAVTALLSNTVVNIIKRPAGSSVSDWYYIEYNGVFGYVEATALRVLTKDELGNFTLPSAPAPTVTPSPAPPYTGTGWAKIIKTSVNIRRTPGGTSLTPKDQDKLPLGLVLRYTEGPDSDGWIKVTSPINGITGYVRSDCYVQCDNAGNPVIATPVPSGPSATNDPSVSTQTYIKLIKGGVNVRNNPWGTSYGQLDKGTILPCLGVKMNGSEKWYDIYSAKLGTYGFVLASMAVECDAYGNAIIATPAPAVTPGPDAAITGYVATVMSSVWVRSDTDTQSATCGKVYAKGTVLPLTGAKVTPYGSSYSWYPVQLNDGTRGYIRGDMVFELAQWQLDYYNQYGVCPSPTPGPATPKPGNSDYIITTGDKLWVRADESTKAGTLGQLRLGTVTKFYGKNEVKNSNGTSITWYEIQHEGKTGYLHGDYVRVLTNAEYADYMAANPGLATPTPTPLPDLSTLSDMGLTTVERVKIRGAATMKGAELSLVYTPGTKVTYLKDYRLNVVDEQGTYNWFKVKYGGVTGWMRGDCVRILTEDEKAMYNMTGNPDSAPEASYTTLTLLSTGDAVTKLQQKLVEKGYLAASEVTGTYYESTRQAVIAFQRAHGKLTVDGIAGENTQHALFGTVPEGTYTGGTVTPVLYPVEKIDWFKGGIQSIYSVGTVAIVTDVYTGISFRAQRLYGDNHADCEPKTTEDTAAICRIYGVSTPQEIDDREQELQSYRRRPLWVTIGGRTFAASMYGIPHNPGGDRIPDNGYTGQFCIHFVNSMTHGSKDSPAHVDTSAAINGWFGHQEAIQYAYSHSQSGTK